MRTKVENIPLRWSTELRCSPVKMKVCDSTGDGGRHSEGRRWWLRRGILMQNVKREELGFSHQLFLCKSNIRWAINTQPIRPISTKLKRHYFSHPVSFSHVLFGFYNTNEIFQRVLKVFMGFYNPNCIGYARNSQGEKINSQIKSNFFFNLCSSRSPLKFQKYF